MTLCCCLRLRRDLCPLLHLLWCNWWLLGLRLGSTTWLLSWLLLLLLWWCLPLSLPLRLLRCMRLLPGLPLGSLTYCLCLRLCRGLCRCLGLCRLGGHVAALGWLRLCRRLSWLHGQWLR